MRSSNLCSFGIAAQFVGTGMLGGRHEYDPRLSVQATFDRYKMREQWALEATRHQKRPGVHVTVGLGAAASAGDEAVQLYERDDDLVSYATQCRVFELPHLQGEMRGDASLHFELICATRDFGVKEIDERQAPYTETHNTCGEVQLEVYDLMRAYLQAGRPARFAVERPVLDLKVLERKAQELRQLDAPQGGRQQQQSMTQERWNAYVEEAAQLTSKGAIRFDVSFRHLDVEAYHASVFGIENLKTRCLHSRDSTALQESMVPLGARPAHKHKHSRRHHGGLQSDVARSPEPGRAYEPLLYTSQRGQDAMLQCLEQHVLRPYCANFVKLQAQDPEPLHRPLNDNVANLQLPMWVSKAGKLPVPCYWSSSDPVTREYASEALRLRDLQLYGFDARTERCFERMFRSSLRRHGLSETRFQSTVQAHFSLKNRSRQLDPLFLVCEEVLADVGTFAANSAYYTADYRFMPTGRENTGQCTMLSLDSWDPTLVNDEGRGDDCEGMDQATMQILRSYLFGREGAGWSQNGGWQSALLQSVHLLLRHTVLQDLGATVTSAYFDNNAPVDLKKQHELPKIDSRMDREARCAGHCHGFMAPLGDTIQRAENGNLRGTAVLERLKQADLRDAVFKARDAQRRILVLEPTGTIEPRILPVEESYACSAVLCAKKKAERYFLKALRLRLQSQQELGEMFNGEGVQHYVELRAPDDAVTPFYREPVHGSSVDLWKRPEGDIALAQFALAKLVPGAPGQYTYGVKIADYIRHPEEYALVFPFYDSRVAWETDVKPFIESVQHQLPISCFGRYSDEKYAKLHSSYHEPGTLHAKYDMQVPRPESAKQREFEALAASVCEQDGLAIVRLQSRHWKFAQSEEKTRDLQRFLRESPGLVGHAFYTEHQLPVCDPFIEILCVVDVKQCLAMGAQQAQAQHTLESPFASWGEFF
jgi:hypothetical protein